jgi:hypothetical protein
MSRIAVHHWQHRIAPVFDVGGSILVLDDGSGTGEEHLMRCLQPLHRAEELQALHVGILICGAISVTMKEALEARGISVVGFVAGDLDRVLSAWNCGGLDDSFAMPGCRCAGRGRHGGGQSCGFGPRSQGAGGSGPSALSAGSESAVARRRQRRGGFGAGGSGRLADS